MAHKKGEGSVKNGRDSQSKRLGVKIYGGQPALQETSSFVNAEQFIILVKMLVLEETLLLFALTDGVVEFKKGKNDKTTVSVELLLK